MKGKRMSAWGLAAVCGFALLCLSAPALYAAEETGTKPAQYASDKEKFSTYRATIKKECGIDIKNFKEQIKGGRSAGQKVIKYPLDQLLMGIKVEREHTGDGFRALEISMDHLEEFPDYYTRLQQMEDEAKKALKKP
jgi:uncharacterized protein DUF5661